MANSPAPRASIDVGSVIDKYVIEALIGRGGMGAVFLARHRTLTDKKVAIKVLHAEIHDADIQARFKREAQIATRINHPNIVEVHDFDVTPEGVPFLVLEYLEGQTLAQRLAQGPIPLEQIMAIVRQVGSALAAAHREGVVHRDLKPQNIFLVPTEIDGRVTEVAKVLDFGISKWRGSETVKTQESALLGTPQYMAPEQATGKHDSVDARTDVFALGSIVYEMLVGHPAFQGASIPEVVFKVVYEQPEPLAASVPDTVAGAVRQAMNKQADERFDSVSSFVEALTGTALSTFRPSMITKPSEGFASGSKKVAGFDALGDTVGSGDYAGAAPAAADPPRTEPSQTPVSGKTVLAPSSTSDPAKPARDKRPMWWLLGGIAAVAATAVIMWTVMHRPDRADQKAERREERKEERAEQKAEKRAEIAAPPPVVSDGPVTSPNGKPPEKQQDKPKAADKPRPPDKRVPPKQETKPREEQPSPPPVASVPEAAPDDVDSVKETVASALAAFDSGDWDRADRFANAAINQGGRIQRAKGAMIKGLVACERRDVEGVNAQLKALTGFPAMKRRVIASCKTRGMDVGGR